MKRRPWGICSGACAIATFFITLGIVAGYLVFSAIAAQTGDTISLFENWWQILLFVFGVFFAAGFCVFTVFYFLQNYRLKKQKSISERGGNEQ